MLVVIAGTDPKARAVERRKIWQGPLEEIETDKVSVEEFAALAATDSLFGEAKGYRLQNIFSTDAQRGLDGDAFIALAEALVSSPHTFILEEEKLLVGPKRALEKAGAKIIEIKAVEKKEPFNVFALGNALSARDRKKLWLGLTTAFASGVAPENIAGILAWKARTLASGARSEEDKKAWAALSRELVVMYHDSHRGLGDLALLLERFALRV
jgi:hypothetical protein